MMNSEERAYKNKIRELHQEKEQIGGIVLMEVTRIIRTAEYLTDEAKDALISDIWKGRREERGSS